MPCSDTASQLILKLSASDTVLDYLYSKYTCGRAIGAASKLLHHVRGMAARDILGLSGQRLAVDLKLEDEADLFLLTVELEALKAAIGGYLGIDVKVTPRYSIAGISQEPNHTEIHLHAEPTPNVPDVPLPCSAYNK